MTNKMTNMCL